MVFHLLRDLEMTLPKAKRPRLPMEVVDEDDSCTKESLCGTPFSQATTAPSTPLRFFLPDPLDDLLPPLPSPLPLRWRQELLKADLFKAPPSPRYVSPAPALSICLSPWWAHYRQTDEALVGTPQPQVYLPRGQQQFAVLEFMDKVDSTVAETSQLEKEYLPRGQHQFVVLESVDKCEYQFVVDEAAFADDFDQMEDAAVHEIDEEDEWMKIDDLYIPSEREGICVLTVNPDSVGSVGHALTPDGQVIDLNGGGPVFFSCQPQSSFGHNRKVAAIRMAKASSDAHLSRVAADVDAKKVCSIDEAGTAHGAAALQSPASAAALDAATARRNRLKLFHRKRHLRQGGPPLPLSGPAQSLPVLSVDASGSVAPVERSLRRREARIEVHRGDNTPTSVIIIDFRGLVWDAVDPESDPSIEEVFTDGVLRENEGRSGLQEDDLPAIALIFRLLEANGVARDQHDIFVGL